MIYGVYRLTQAKKGLNFSDKDAEDATNPYLSRLIKLIPSDVLALYTIGSNSNIISLNGRVQEFRDTCFNAAFNTYNSWSDLGLKLPHDLGKANFWKKQYRSADELESDRQKNTATCTGTLVGFIFLLISYMSGLKFQVFAASVSF